LALRFVDEGFNYVASLKRLAALFRHFITHIPTSAAGDSTGFIPSMQTVSCDRVSTDLQTDEMLTLAPEPEAARKDVYTFGCLGM
jgi:hypothetical protein